MNNRQKNEGQPDGLVFRLGLSESWPQINWNIVDIDKQIGRLIIKKNSLSNLGFSNITMKILNEKPKFKIQIGSKMGLKGFNEIKSILSCEEFQFFIDFSAHKHFDRIRLSNTGLKLFLQNLDSYHTLRHLNLNENNITSEGVKIIK